MVDFPQGLKDWRRLRRLSQLRLALEAEVSPRHLAFLETGRARPSRQMVLRLAEVLALPRGDCNGLLAAAGFAAQYPALPLDAAELAAARRAMDWTIARHAPYPALILDRLWVIVAMNDPAQRLFGPAGLLPGVSMLALMATPGLPGQLIENWGEVGHHTLGRLRAESAAAGGIPQIDRAVAALAADPDVAAWRPTGGGRVVIPAVYRLGQARLPLISTNARFGTAEEVVLADMKIELMIPDGPDAEALLLAV